MQTIRTANTTDRPPKVSAVIIAENEEDRIEPCLRSLAGWVDEIVVVDSGSEDRTVELCRRYTPDVIETHWRGYGKQKQFAIDAASHDWVLSIDADEVVSPELREEILRVLAANPTVAAFQIPREYQMFGKTLRHGDCGRAPVRLFRRSRARFSDDEVHEKVIADGRVERLRSRLIHYSIRDMDHAFAKMREYAKLWAVQNHHRGRRVNLLQCCLHSAWCVFDVLIRRGGWLDGRCGFVLAVLQSQYTFNKYITLWSLGRERATKNVEVESAATSSRERVSDDARQLDDIRVADQAAK